MKFFSLPQALIAHAFLQALFDLPPAGVPVGDDAVRLRCPANYALNDYIRPQMRKEQKTPLNVFFLGKKADFTL